MPKLHELLAVESNLKGQADKTRTELSATFEKTPHLFTEKTVVFKSSEENVPDNREEQLDLQTTVRSELKWFAGIISPALDTSYAVAVANTQAKADIVLDSGVVLVKDVPATALLELEKRTNELHDLVSSIKTLDPAKGFTLDANRGKDIYKAREDRRQRTKKVVKPIVLYPATTEHPAQTQLISEDIVSGTLQTQEWSGLITPTEKAEMLERVEKLRRAVKSARSRANETSLEVIPKIGGKLLEYVFG